MKKKLFSVLALLLTSVFALSGCYALPELSFSNSFCGGSGSRDDDPQTGYTEILEYNVNYEETAEGLTVDSSLKNNKDFKFEYSNGKFVSTFKVLSSFPKTLSSDIIDNLNNDQKQAYYLSTEFSIDVKFEIGKDTFTHTDRIISETYFCGPTLAYAPVYSKTITDYTNLFFSSFIAPVPIKTVSEIKYSKSDYIIDFKLNEEPNKITKEKYSYKTIIDNNQLLFILRNFTVEAEKVSSIPIVTAIYKEPTALAINNFTAVTITPKKDNPITYNFSPITEGIATNHYRFYKNDLNARGSIQHLFIQSKMENSNLPYKALPMRYVEPLTTYGSYLPMGSLVYNLIDVSING